MGLGKGAWRGGLALWVPVLLLGAPVPGASAATAGGTVFGAHCARCHSVKDVRTFLRTRWEGRTAAELLETTRTTMPAETPGALGDDEYRAAVAHLLALAGALPETGLPADPAELRIAVADERVPRSPARGSDVPWAHFGGDLAATRYAPLSDLDRNNVAGLRIAWRWSARNYGPRPELRNVAMPVVQDGRVYLGAGATRSVVAIDAGTGETLWLWRPDEGPRFEAAARKDSGKGVALGRGADGTPRVFTVTPGYFLVSLDARTGVPDPAFGVEGRVDLTEGLRRAPGRALDIGLTAPPLVVGDVVVVGSAHAVSFRPPSRANVKGDVRAYHAHTGERLWTFRTIPEPGEPGHDTWLESSAGYTGNAGVWAPMSADPELGLVYLPVESATGDQYGGDRPGANLFSSSLVAVDLRTGERRWHFQHVHHDIWDWDTPAAPILADRPDGRKLVVLLTKQGFAFVFDRATGEPIWPVEERPVPASDVPGEWTAPTQPFPRRPPPFDRQGVTREDLIDWTPAIRAEVDALLETVRLGPLYQPPSLAEAPDGTRGTLRLPSATGGANWEGGAYDPDTGILYVPSRTHVDLMRLVHDPEVSDVRWISGGFGGPEVLGLPLARPPWGRITALDLEAGTRLWTVANGDTPAEVRAHPELAGLELPRTGKPTRAGILVTETLLFAGEGYGGDPVFRAHDKATGEILAEIPLPATQAGPPSTYRHRGRQFVVFTVADGERPAELVALALPGVD